MFANLLSEKTWEIINISCYDASWDQDGRFEYHKPYELKKVGETFFIDFSFFTLRFFVKNLWKFLSQMGNPLGVYETNYKVKFQKFIIGENMASFRLALSTVKQTPTIWISHEHYL